MESRWMSHREWYFETKWFELLATLMPQKQVMVELDKLMEEYDREHKTNKFDSDSRN